MQKHQHPYFALTSHASQSLVGSCCGGGSCFDGDRDHDSDGDRDRDFDGDRDRGFDGDRDRGFAGGCGLDSDDRDFHLDGDDCDAAWAMAIDLVRQVLGTCWVGVG